jgi:alpha-amylase/alpha-mannosidase (GH57 family)
MSEPDAKRRTDAPPTSRHLCIHGHFYQPPRENPWLEDVELQDSAYPNHDWNERITAECYAPNTASRILGPDRRILNIVNNFAWISFNVGPTLLSWLERKQPQVYQAILQADRESRERFSGHGSAIAQAYNHLIMPLADERDRRSQVLWGIRDFEKRFQRRPEGMWLPETAVDLRTLEILAENGIRFTILAPNQAKGIRKIGEKEWQEVGGVDPRVPYLCPLPGGGSIVLFFYDGPASQEIGFGSVLESGEQFAGRLLGLFDKRDSPQLVHVATDGETYGHHRPFGDMALAYCLHHVQANNLARITVYGEYLEHNPPEHEVRIHENSSWSCVHGVERWRSDCGCNSGMHRGWQQKWRGPLRSALDWLRDACAPAFQDAGLLRDPWQARDDYIEVVLDRSPENVDRFLERWLAGEADAQRQARALKALELQRNAMLMYTSCGWFFDEISGLESTQVLLYAARVLQLAKECFALDLEGQFLERLRQAPSNLQEFGDGGGVYETLIRPAVVDLRRVGVHYAVSTLMDGHPEEDTIYCYSVHAERRERETAGKMSLSTGRVSLTSQITREQSELGYAVLHLGGPMINGAVRFFPGEQQFEEIRRSLRQAFRRADIPEVIRLMDEHFGSHNYSLWHLFRDERRAFFARILASTLEGIREQYRGIYQDNYPTLQAMKETRVPIPAALRAPLEFTLNQDLGEELAGESPRPARLREVLAEMHKWGLSPDASSFGLGASRLARRVLRELAEAPRDQERLERSIEVLDTLRSARSPLNLWEAQNEYFRISQRLLSEVSAQAEAGGQEAKAWLEGFRRLGSLLEVTT